MDIQNQRSVEEAKVIEKIKTNPKAFYAFAKRSYEYKSPVGPLKDCNGVLQSDPHIMGSILQKQYSSAFSDPKKLICNSLMATFTQILPRIL